MFYEHSIAPLLESGKPTRVALQGFAKVAEVRKKESIH
jgi:hypothetical protein